MEALSILVYQYFYNLLINTYLVLGLEKIRAEDILTPRTQVLIIVEKDEKI